MQAIDTGSGLGTSSAWRPDLRPFNKDNKNDLKAARKDFAIHAWLGNWDAVGLVYDNLLTDSDGDVIHVDPGGALLFRAQGEPKGNAWNKDASEWNTLRDKAMNPQSGSVFADMTPQEFLTPHSSLRCHRPND